MNILKLILSLVMMILRSVLSMGPPKMPTTPSKPGRPPKPAQPAQPAVPPPAKFRLGAGSLRELVGVDERLQSVVRRAIEITDQDFTVFDGLRTTAEQQAHFRNGASKLDGVRRKSKHQLGRAVDLVPFIAGKVRFELTPLLVIVQAMRQAAREKGVAIRWGGAWVRLDDTTAHPQELIDAYVARKRAAGKKPFIDGWHFELI